ncbi:unnamed protein product, partial [Iphiclides podalirius]
MIIFLSELQKNHLHLLHNHTPQVLVDFCKLTIDYLNNGINKNKFTIAAEKLDTPVENIQNLIQALAYLIVEGCKHNLSELDFKSSLAIAGFSNDQQQVLVKLFTTKKREISSALNILQQQDYGYEDLTWRFEIQMASRRCKHIIKPMITLDFVITIPKDYGQEDKYRQDVLRKKVVNAAKSHSRSSSGYAPVATTANRKHDSTNVAYQQAEWQRRTCSFLPALLVFVNITGRLFQCYH